MALQFVQRARDEAQFAVKFFFTRQGYESELAHYTNPRLKNISVRPFMFMDNSDGAVATSDGYVFPPMIITERGEVHASLCTCANVDMWCDVPSMDLLLWPLLTVTTGVAITMSSPRV